MAPLGSDPILLYDGHCGFCNGTVQFILARDPNGRMRFAPLQGEFAQRVITQHPELRGVDSLILVEREGQGGPERVTVRSKAVLAIARYLGGWWRTAAVLGLVPRPVRDWVYDAFARHRYRCFGRYDRCPAPRAEVRSRFLEDPMP